MAVTVSLVVVFGALAYLLIHYKAVGMAAFTAVFLFGFLTAQSPAAGPINNVIDSIVTTITALAT